MELIAPPGVYRPQGDTEMLADVIAAAGVAGADVLDVGTGTGALAIAAMRAGARSVTGVDVSARAVAAARLNARLHGVRLRVHHGDVRAVAGRRFDVVLANPPYVPSRHGSARGAARAWDAGRDGRDVLDPLCAATAALLRTDGFLLLVQSALSQPDVSIQLLRAAGLGAQVVERRVQPFGPVLLGRTSWLEQVGLIQRGQRLEELVVIRAQR